MTARRSDAIRREDILTVAAQLFREQGYEATSVEDIASKLGIVKGSLYHHIRGKGDLLFEIVAEVHEALMNAQSSRPMQEDPIEELRGFIVTHTEVLAALRNQSAVFYLELRSLRAGEREQIWRWRIDYQNQLVGLVENAKEGGLLEATTSSGVVARSILGMVNSMHGWYEPDGPIDPTTLGSTFADIVLRGVVRRKEE
ncbi:MAG: TetR/AcrR family transcriptional regulator [Acidimicrobiales bacterium]